jgi:hypothetical protein
MDRLMWTTDTSHGEIPLPNMQPVRINGRPGTSRVIVEGRGTVLIYDLAHSVPQRLPIAATGGQFTMLDDDTVLTWTNSDPWSLFHLSTRQRIEVPFRWAGFGSLGEVRGDEKRALVRFTEVRTHLLELRDDPKPMRHLASGPSAIDHPDQGFIVGALIPGDATMFADSDNRLYATFGDAHPNEIVQMDGTVRGICSLGRLKFGAITDNGEVVRGSLEGNGTLERTRVPARDDLMVEGDLAGHLFIAAGKELLQWDGSVDAVAKLDRPIVGMWPVAGGLALALSDRSIVAYDSETRRWRPIVQRNARLAQVTPDGTMLAVMLDGGHVVVAEFPDGEPWELPASYLPATGMAVTPSSRAIVIGSDRLDMWKLPRVGPDLHAWIDTQTNARERGRRVEWPWQGAINVDP